jgi:hypothetical protein
MDSFVYKIHSTSYPFLIGVYSNLAVQTHLLPGPVEMILIWLLITTTGTSLKANVNRGAMLKFTVI